MAEFATTPPIPYVPIADKAAEVRAAVGLSPDTTGNTNLNAILAAGPAASRNAIELPVPTAKPSHTRLAHTQQVFQNQADATHSPSSYPWSTPLRVLVVGDSLISLSGAFGLDQMLGSVGDLELTHISPTGGASLVTGGEAFSPNRRYFNLPTGASYTFKRSGIAPIAADAIGLAYIKEPGAGSMVIEVSYNNASSWATLKTIDCSNASVIGAWEESPIPYSDQVVLRISSSGGPVKFLSCGGFIRGGGGVITLPIFATGGLNANQVTTPTAVTAPIIAGFAPHLVNILWHDGADIYDDGGLMDVFAANTRLAKSNLDFLLVAKNPELATSADYMVNTMLPALRAWADRNQAAFYDSYSIFGDLVEAQNLGLLEAGGGVHPTTLGYAYRNARIAKDVFSSFNGNVGATSLRAKIAGALFSLEPHQNVTGFSNKAILCDAGIRFKKDVVVDGSLWLRVPNETGGWTTRGGFSQSSTTNDTVYANQASGHLRPALSGQRLGTPTFQWELYGLNSQFSGTTRLSGLPTHADNAAAIAAGLAVDRVYRTATGVLMVRY